MDIYIHIYGYIQATYGMYIYYDDAVMWCPAESSTSFESLYNQATGDDAVVLIFFLQQWLRFWPKSALCVKSNLCHVHCITASLRCAELGIWIVVFLSRNFQGFCSCTTKPDYLQWILCLSKLLNCVSQTFDPPETRFSILSSVSKTLSPLKV